MSARAAERPPAGAVFGTARLEVRAYTLADIPAHLALRDDAAVRAYMHWWEAVDGTAARIAAARARVLPDDLGWINLAVARRADGAVVGDMGLSVADATAWMGLAFLPAVRRRGLGRELVHGATNWLAAHGITRVRVAVDCANAASLALFADLDFRVIDEGTDGFGPFRVLAGPAG